jgi:hypothetical protein
MLVNLFVVFNERDAERRLKAIADNYTAAVIWTDPDGTTHGHQAEPAPTSNARKPKARAAAKHSAASNDSSSALSTKHSKRAPP